MSSDPSYFDPRLVAALRRFSSVAALLCMLVGAAALAAWTANQGAATALISGQPPLLPLTALGVLLGGAALWLLPNAPGRPAVPPSLMRRRLALICAGVTATLGALILLEYLLRVNLGLDRALFAPAVQALHAAAPGRPSAASAANLLLAGVALLALDPSVARRVPRRLAPAGLLLGLLLSSLGLLNYFYEFGSIGPVAPYLPVEPSSALACALLTLGVLAAAPTGP